MNVLIVNHASENCGVYQYGKSLFKAVKEIADISFTYCEVSGTTDIAKHINDYTPNIIIYNWHPFTMPWCNDDFIKDYPNIIHSSIWHDPNCLPPAKMKNIISHDPETIESMSNTRNIFSIFPLIQTYDLKEFTNQVPTIGSCGFLNDHKQYLKIIDLVQNEFTKATVRLHIPSATFGSRLPEILKFKTICESHINNPGISLNFSYDFLSIPKLIEWLSKNDLNIFLYDKLEGHGISGAVERALSAKKPIAINRSYMFRHLWKVSPSIFVNENKLATIIENGFKPLEDLCLKWSPENFKNKWKYIINKME